MRAVNRNIFTLGPIVTILICFVAANSQSTSQDFPTPVTTNEISGTIQPRDVGDARLTSYFYQFDGSQGDLFINIVTRNLNGDIDVFIQNGLRPLTKIVVYADLGESETGRVIYLRKPEKMILRVQGRTPGDDAATFRIKFAGSFIASTLAEPAGEPVLPSVTAKNESGIRVNSVGTIVEVIPKATPTPAAAPAETVTGGVDERSEPAQSEKEKHDAVAKTKPEEKPTVETPDKKIGVVITDNIPEAPAKASPPATPRRSARGRRRTPPSAPPVAADEKVDSPPVETPLAKTTGTTARTRRGRTQPAKATEPKQPDPLEKVNLVIVFKDGSTISRPMSEVLRFAVDKGVLTVISKDGSIGRYSIFDVAKVTIE